MPWCFPLGNRGNQAEGIPILENHNPMEYVVEDGRLKAMKFDIIEYSVEEDGTEVFTPAGAAGTVDCSLVLLAIGQANAFPWMSATSVLSSTRPAWLWSTM